MVELPLYGTEESRTQWKPLLDLIHERLAERGLSHALILGIGHCGGLHKNVIGFFKDISPGIGWHIAKHNRPQPREFPQNRYVEWMYIPRTLPVPSKYPRFPNDGKGLTCLMMQRLRDALQPPIAMRTMAERAYLLGDSGAGRICLDYWPVLNVGGSRRKTFLYDRYPTAIASQRKPQLMELSIPGPVGALSTPKIEALREGLQETEARFLIEDALADGKVGGELAERCKRLIDSRATLCRITHYEVDQLVAIEAWPARAEETYRLAAEIGRQGDRP
ncbi:MAG: hypothetical protein AMS14_09095 [Planctomycetes bacterium DG_20]|nr:MAG: hypothetical protein AMS14_09095 [Planctomycetes bacterium DG_20]